MNNSGVGAGSALRDLGWQIVHFGLRLAARARIVIARGETGGALIETALIAPVLITLLLGFLDAGILYVDNIQLQDAARAAARYAISNPTSWNTAEPAVAKSIQGQAELNAKSLISNTRNVVGIAYLTSSTNMTVCGNYVVGSPGTELEFAL